MGETDANRTRDLLHTGMWTLLGLMAIGLVIVPLVRPSIVATVLFFAWSQGMVGYVAFRLFQDMRRRSAARTAAPQARVHVAPHVVKYTFDPSAGERPRARPPRHAPPPQTDAPSAVADPPCA